MLLVHESFNLLKGSSVDLFFFFLKTTGHIAVLDIEDVDRKEMFFLGLVRSAYVKTFQSYPVHAALQSSHSLEWRGK